LANQNAPENVLADIQFLKDQFMVVGLEKFTGIFDEPVMWVIFSFTIPTPFFQWSDRHLRPRQTAEEIRSGETSKTANTP
jgi:hypothetical protein